MNSAVLFIGSYVIGSDIPPSLHKVVEGQNQYDAWLKTVSYHMEMKLLV